MSEKELRPHIKEKLETTAEPQNRLEYSLENFKQLFPHSSVKTPLENVRVFPSQFEKLGSRDGGRRQQLLGAMYQTLIDPVFIIKSPTDAKASLYIKTFGTMNDIKKIVMVVVEHNRGKIVAKSTHQKDLINILNKIKNPGDILYEKGCPGSNPDGNTGGGAGGTGEIP